jgi:hypothetical protein
VSVDDQTAKTCVTKVIVQDLAPNNNYVRTRTIMTAGKYSKTDADAIEDPTKVSHVTHYYDALGRDMQTVAKRSSPMGKDMITVKTFDQYDRESIHHLPYTSTNSNGDFQRTPLLDLTAFNALQFPSETVFHGTTSYERSPLSRTVATYAPGDDWAIHGVSTQYLFNTPADSVLAWTVDTTGTILDHESYATGELMKTVTFDEDSNQVIEFKDKDGHVVLKKVLAVRAAVPAHPVWACTYYVYDDGGNLVFVIPPEAVKRLQN